MAPDAEASSTSVLGDRADAGMDDLELHLVAGKFGQHFAEHFHRALHVGLDDDRQFLGFAGLELLVQLIERDARAGAARQRSFAQLVLPVIDDVARLGFVGHLEMVARFGHALQAKHFDRSGRPRLLHRAAMIVEQGAHFAVYRADDENIAGVQRAVLHQARWPPGRGPCPRAIPAPCRLPGAAGLARNSRRSATSRIISSSLSRFFFCLAETSTITVSPPHSSGISPRSESCRLTRSGCASAYRSC